jgi:hypothetical protein
MIWNRAALDDGGASPGAGDTALAAALAFHGLARAPSLDSGTEPHKRLTMDG